MSISFDKGYLSVKLSLYPVRNPHPLHPVSESRVDIGPRWMTAGWVQAVVQALLCIVSSSNSLFFLALLLK